MIWKRIGNKLIFEISKFCNNAYERAIRRKLKNDNFSIICSNCLGGIIYHRLGIRFLSPTINLWMHQDDFLKFILNLKDYLLKELEFIEGDYDYPIAMLGDIKIYFNHSETKEDAKKSWNARKGRINYDNLFVIMYDRDGINKEDILKLKDLQCKNKIVLSSKEYSDIDYVKKIEISNRINGEQCLDKDILGFRTVEKQWNFVQWLNCK